MRVAIIGGGASGIVQLKVLATLHEYFPTTKPFELKLFESYDKLGGIFLHHSYEDAELVSSKWLTSFSDFRPKPQDADFYSAERYREYLEEYASHFRLWPYIHLSTYVTSVRRGDRSEHVVTYKGPDGTVTEWECDAIAVCTGVHADPNIPHIPGIENVPVVMHSSDFKAREQFGKDKTVLILGTGETGMDMAHLAITSDTKQVILGHRGGWIGAPKRLPTQRFLPWILGARETDQHKLPVDVSQVTLFDTMYVHPIVRDSMIVWDYYHNVSLYIGCWLCGGDSHGIDQHVGQRKVFYNKAWQRVQNNITTPYRPTQWGLSDRIRRFFFHTEFDPPSRIIDVAPFPTSISSDGVAHFPITDRPESVRINQQVVKPDVIVLATGYLTSFPFLNTPENEGRRPYPQAFDADVRQIWKRDDPTVGFIGFVRPGFGAIPPLSELQAMLFAMNLLNCVPKPLDPDDEWHYRIIHAPDSRIVYGVEHDSYAYQLAKDMDIAPSFTEVLKLSLQTKKGWRLPYIWGAGASFNTKFRLRGAWRWYGAERVMTEELWETVTRRENFWGTINLFCYLYAGFWTIMASLHLARPYKHHNEAKRIIQELSVKRESMKKNMVNGVSSPKATMNGAHKVNGEGGHLTNGT